MTTTTEGPENRRTTGGGETAASPRRVNRVAVIAGLAAAWGGPALLVGADRLLGLSDTTLTRLVAELVLWCLLGLVLAIVLLWERQPVSTLNLRSPRWSSLGWGLLLAAVTYAVMLPLGDAFGVAQCRNSRRVWRGCSRSRCGTVRSPS